MRTGIGLLFRSFVSLLFTHAVLVQSRETLLYGVLGPKLLMVVGCITGLVGVALSQLCPFPPGAKPGHAVTHDGN
jgi:hypothetical protein